jgi:hypothetical protein
MIAEYNITPRFFLRKRGEVMHNAPRLKGVSGTLVGVILLHY